jgi:transglutaminase-like putative cysteine protease
MLPSTNATQPQRVRKLRPVALALLLAAGLEIILGALFSRTPGARTYVPWRVVESEAAFAWNPADAPRWFQMDDPTVPEGDYFRAALGPQVDAGASAFAQGLAIMDWVRQGATTEEAVQAIPGDPIAVREAMERGTPAQCGNFATLFAASAASVGLTEVRTFVLMGADGASGEGHVANEVWVPEWGKWVFLDPMNNAYVLLDGQPASLLEIRALVLSGETDRLEPVAGPNGHTPPDGLFALYDSTMAVAALAPRYNPLVDSYRPSAVAILSNRLPDMAGLPALASSLDALISGRSRQVVLMDDLAKAASDPLPIARAKLLFAGLVADGFVTAGLLGWLALRGVRALFKRGKQDERAAGQVEERRAWGRLR